MASSPAAIIQPDQIQRWPIDKLVPYEKNARTHSAEQVEQIKRSIQEFGFTNPLLASADGGLLAGHGRLEAARALGLSHVPVVILDHLTARQRKAYILADNRLALNAGWDEAMLREELIGLDLDNFDMDLLGWSDDELEDLLDPSWGDGSGDDGDGSDDDDSSSGGGSLADRFGIAPFSVLNAREGWWQARKRAWLALGIRSELGRGQGEHNAAPGGSPMVAGYSADGERLVGLSNISKGSKARTIGGQDSLNSIKPNLLSKDKQPQHVDGVLMKSDSGNDPQYYYKKQEAEKKLGRELTTEEFQRDHYQGPDSYESGTSIFDPVLCELAYRWFSPDGGIILDPFAGGSVRGIVASHCGRRYVGVDLRQEQIDANQAQEEIAADPLPIWRAGDSREIDAICADTKADMIFSCPPYADLEVYSDDPADLSTLDYDSFKLAYREIIAKASFLLKDDRFACFVVGDVRDKKGNYYNFVGDTVEAFRIAGLHLYNEAILVTAVGSLPIRAGKQFAASRKLGKTHQNVLVFVKGDGKKATAACGVCDFSDEEPGDQSGGEQSEYGEKMTAGDLGGEV